MAIQQARRLTTGLRLRISSLPASRIRICSSTALDIAADAAQRKGNTPKAVSYAQSALDIDAKDYDAMLLISGELARGTRENDLDKEEKLAKAEKLANDAIAADRHCAQAQSGEATDDQWNALQEGSDFAGA